VSTLQNLRDIVRLQTDLDAEDLPNTVLDGYLREGFDRTFAAELRWPFFEHSWTLTLAALATTIALPTSPEVAFFMRVRSDTDEMLVQLAQTFAEDNFTGDGTTDDPSFYSVWGSTVYLWPVPSGTARSYTARGYRKPTWSATPTVEVDGDDRLHQAIAHYAVALAYAQLEDAELEAVYMNRWGALVDVIRRNVMQPNFHQPLVLNGGLGGHARQRSWMGN